MTGLKVSVTLTSVLLTDEPYYEACLKNGTCVENALDSHVRHLWCARDALSNPKLKSNLDKKKKEEALSDIMNLISMLE